jgi:hypothetical protein
MSTKTITLAAVLALSSTMAVAQTVIPRETNHSRSEPRSRRSRVGARRSLSLPRQCRSDLATGFIFLLNPRRFLPCLFGAYRMGRFNDKAYCGCCSSGHHRCASLRAVQRSRGDCGQGCTSKGDGGLQSPGEGLREIPRDVLVCAAQDGEDLRRRRHGEATAT